MNIFLFTYILIYILSINVNQFIFTLFADFMYPLCCCLLLTSMYQLCSINNISSHIMEIQCVPDYPGQTVQSGHVLDAGQLQVLQHHALH